MEQAEKIFIKPDIRIRPRGAMRRAADMGALIRLIARRARKIGDFITTRLDLNFSKCDVFPVSRGGDFLGYRHFKKYILVRKRTSKRIKRRVMAMSCLVDTKKISPSRALSIIGSAFGYNFRQKNRTG